MKFRSPAALLALLVSLASTAAVVSAVGPLIGPSSPDKAHSKPPSPPNTSALKSAPSQGRRYQLLFGPELDVVGALKLPPDVVLNTSSASGYAPVGTPVVLDAEIKYIDAGEIAKVEFFDGTTSLGTATAASNYTLTRSFAPAGVRSLKVVVTDTGNVPTSATRTLSVIDSVVRGRFHGPTGTYAARTLSGWACSTGYSTATSVRIYFGGVAWPGTFPAGDSTPASDGNCQSDRTAFGFNIPVTAAMYAQHSGKAVTIRAISAATGGEEELPNLGGATFLVNRLPAATQPSVPDPGYGVNYVVGESIVASSTFTDLDGDLRNVAFLLGADTKCPTDLPEDPPTSTISKQCPLSASATGTFTLTANATDYRQVSSSSPGVSLTFVSPTPTTSAGSATASHVVTLSAANLLNLVEIETYASATSSERLGLYASGQFTRGAGGSSGTLAFTAGSTAERNALASTGLYVKVVNLTPGMSNGTRWASDARRVVSNTPPTVTLTSPGSASFQLGDVVSLEASASDDVGVSAVSFQRQVNGVWSAVATDDTSAPYVVAWRIGEYEATGTFKLRAVARDSSSASSNSNEVSITIAARAQPESPPAAPLPDLDSDRVGTTAGQFRVDESGAATYSIPIYAPPGRAGVTPQVALSYSSQGGMGALGKGWSISGTSVIARCRATTEAGDPESALGPVDLTSNDRFCLDGQRLLEITAPVGAACAAHQSASVREFRTEIESFQRVCAYTFDASKGPRYFTVERKDGSLSWYGDRRTVSAAADGGLSSGYVAVSSGAIYAWAQTRLEDSAGNFMDFAYLKGTTAGVDLGEQLLARIDYTGKLATAMTGEEATFASIGFVYEPTRVGMRYFAGEALYGNKRLRYVTVKDGGTTLRRYDTRYGATASGEDQLLSLQECRPNAPTDEPNSATDVCLPATTFGWSTAQYDFTAATKIGELPHGSLDKFEGHKLADIDGDGRQDLLWMKDDEDGGECGGERLHILMSRLDGFGQVNFAPILDSLGSSDSRCIQDDLPEDTSSGWFLLDYDGDGREDLFLRSPALGKWKAHRATGLLGTVAAAFDFQTDLLVGIAIPASSARNKPWDQPQLADFNGDGLMDIVYPKFGTTVTLHARLMERSGSGVFGWGSERTLDFFGDGQVPCTTEPGATQPCFKVLGLYRRLNYQQLTDFDADGRSDLLLEIEPTRACENGGLPDPGPGDPWDPHQIPSRGTGAETEGGTSSCPSQIYPYAIRDVLSGTINARLYGPNQVFFTSVYSSTSTSSYFRASLADINGDGLSDAVFTGGPNDGNPMVRMNLGTQFDLPFGNMPAARTNPTHVHVLDLNGDGRADLTYPDYVPPASTTEDNSEANEYFVARYGQPTGGFGPEFILANKRLQTGCTDGDFGGLACLDRQGFMFGDYDADGAIDYLRIEWKTSGNSNLHLARATSIGKPRDVIESITNGLGAVTRVTYQPMTNKAVYRRLTGSRNAAANPLDRGSPVADLLAPMHLVARTETSAPTATDTAAMARVDYRYVGLRVQAGGRGSLGFDEIHSIDANESTHHVATVTKYAHQFPYIGHPVSTTRTVVPGSFEADSCFGLIAETCFLAADVAAQGFGAYAGIVVSHSASDWESEYTANAASAGGPRPRHVRLAGSTDWTYDLNTGSLLTRVVNTFKDQNQYGQPISGYDGYGNLKKSITQTFDANGTVLYTVSTSNTYSDNLGQWFLGRLTNSTVTHQRPDASKPGGVDSIQRRADFAYDPNTGILTMEETQRGLSSEHLRKFHVLNSYGARVRTHTCSSTLSEAECKATVSDAGFVFQSEAAQDAARIQRYVRQEYDDTERYVDRTYEPFTSLGGTDLATLSVVDRDDYGNVTDALDLHGARSRAAYGFLGRPYYTWTQTAESGAGVASLATYRWCGGAIVCPAGARYREEVTRTGAPKQTTYYDVLARPVFSLSESFNTQLGKRHVGICTDYDNRGRAASVSIPMFAEDANGVLSFSCSSYRTVTDYDALGRPVLTTNPDSSTQVIEYLGLTTRFTDALAKVRSETRNPMGELASSTDASGLVLTYMYDAVGNAKSVTRNAGSGDIVSSALYDASGRKTSQTEPGLGTITYTYNALGEQLSQNRTGGGSITQIYDARGRVVRRSAQGGAEGNSSARYSYDSKVPGAIDYESSLAGSAVSAYYDYDTLGRPISKRSEIAGRSHVTQTRYDSLGRAWKQQDASGRWLKTQYDARGFASGICDSSSGDTAATCSTFHQQTLETDARGNIVREQRGGSAAMTVTRLHDDRTGRLIDVSAGVASGNTTNHAIYHETYDWDAAGNLVSRDKAGQYKEKYSYDELHRLTRGVYLRLLNQPEVQEAFAPLSFQLYYDKLGNICRRTVNSQTSDYHYDGRAGCGTAGTVGTNGGSATASPHAATGFGGMTQTYDALGNQNYASYGGGTADRTIVYTTEQQALEITKGSKKIRFVYGPDGQRAQREDLNANVIESTTQYVGNVELVLAAGQTKIRRYVAGVAVQEITNLTATTPATTTKYLFHDHLGSVVRATNASGAVLEGLDYGPFGERRGYVDPRYPASVPTATNRGFTGHEMLDGTDVVHMNGRIYDSRTWRFLQADPIVQAPNNSQSLNRYSYVWNNPLNATDPSGFVVQRQPSDLFIFTSTVISIAISSAFVGAVDGAPSWGGKVGYAAAGGYSSGYMQTGSGQGGLQGAYAAVLFLGAGAAADHYKWGQGDPMRAALHGVAGGVSAELGGGSFADGFVTAGMSKLLMGNFVNGSGPAAYVKTAIIGGTVSVATGGKFANGAATASLQFAFNQMQASFEEPACDDSCELSRIRTAQLEVVDEAAEAMSTMGDVVEVAAPVPGLPLLKVGRLTFRAGIWSSKKGASAVQNAFGHWVKHRHEFPELANAKQYVEYANAFVSNPPPGTAKFVRGGDTLMYHAESNIFAVSSAQGAVRTMFRPPDGPAYWLRQTQP